MKRQNGRGLSIVMGVATSIITIASLTLAILVILDRKRKKEDKELEEYLESAIQ